MSMPDLPFALGILGALDERHDSRISSSANVSRKTLTPVHIFCHPTLTCHLLASKV